MYYACILLYYIEGSTLMGMAQKLCTYSKLAYHINFLFKQST